MHGEPVGQTSGNLRQAGASNMIPAGVFLDELVRFDFDFVAGVPCSFLTPG